MRGHVTPAADAVSIPSGSTGLGLTSSDGRRLARCLRCDTWIEAPVPEPESARWAVLPPIDELDAPRRGTALQEAIVMRLIAINKGSHALGFTILAVVLALLETNLDRLHTWAGDVVDALTSRFDDTGQGASQDWLARQMRHLFDLKPGTIHVLLALSIAYAVVEWAEAIGLWKERRWAEYLTVIATVGFMPIEIYELVERVTVLRIGALVVNVALLVWLVWAKHLFGVRGGPATLHAELAVDWDEILAAPSPAKGRTSEERPRARLRSRPHATDSRA